MVSMEIQKRAKLQSRTLLSLLELLKISYDDQSMKRTIRSYSRIYSLKVMTLCNNMTWFTGESSFSRKSFRERRTS